MSVSGEPFVPTGDIINDICRRFRQLDAGIEQALADRVEREARQAYALERVYIPSRVPNLKRELAEKVVLDEPSTVQASRLGLSRTTIWRRKVARRGGADG